MINSGRKSDSFLDRYIIQPTMKDRLFDVYFSRDDGAILYTSFQRQQFEKYFQKLQADVNQMLQPLLLLIQKKFREESDKYSSTTNALFYRCR